MSIRVLPSCLVILLALLLSACGGGGTGNEPGQGRLEVGLTDAPVDSALAVVIYFTSVTLHGDDGNMVVEVQDQDGNPGRSIDLLALQSGQWTGLFDEIVPAGHYSWMRLTMDFSRSYIETNEGVFGLRCTSCEQNGLRLNRSFNVDRDAVLALMLDFDLRKSITDPNPNDQLGDYILRPTVRTIATAASGRISGTVDPTLISQLGGVPGCSVYVFNGNDAVLDDVFIPFEPAQADPNQNNPLTTARISEDGTNSYTAAFLPAGNYTAAVTCDAEIDNADSNDSLNFSDSMNVTVVAGDTIPANFSAPVTP